jgi:recombination protein RecA
MAAAKKSNTTSAAIAAKAAAAIFKHTKKKLIEQHKGALPFVPSGSFVIDDLIGGALASDGKPVCPGYPRRRITEIFGSESSGKTTASLEAISEVQAQGGVAMFLDFEHALHHEYAGKVGVKFDKTLMVYEPDNLEEGIKMIYIGILAGVDLIVVDSVASMVTKDEMEKGIDKPAMIGDRARAFAKFLPRIVVWLTKEIPENPKGTGLVFINQTRALINTGGYGGGEDNTTGGKALKFFAYLRLRFTRLRSDVVKKKDRITGKERSYPYGNHTQVKVIKSKVDGKQGYAADIFIRFGAGIDDFHSLIEGGVTNRLVAKNGPTYELGGQKFKGREALRAFLASDPKVAGELRKKLLDALKVTTSLLAEDEEDDMEITMADFGEDGDAEVEAIEQEIEVESASEGGAEG